MEAYYVIIFLHHAAKCSTKMLVFNASLHSKSQKMKEKTEPDILPIFPTTFWNVWILKVFYIVYSVPYDELHNSRNTNKCGIL